MEAYLPSYLIISSRGTFHLLYSHVDYRVSLIIAIIMSESGSSQKQKWDENTCKASKFAAGRGKKIPM
jgi:hypothetical protein